MDKHFKSCLEGFNFKGKDMDKVKEELKHTTLEKGKLTEDLKQMKIVALNMKQKIVDQSQKTDELNKSSDEIKKENELLKNQKESTTIDEIKQNDYEQGSLLEKYQTDNRELRGEISDLKEKMQVEFNK